MTTVVKNRPLSEELRAQTAQVHELAEGAEFTTQLMAGKLTVGDFANYTAQLWFVYDALERAVHSAVSRAARSGGTGILAAVADPRLDRRERLEDDLLALIGPDWRDKVMLLPATARYVARIEGLESPHALVAHHYVRYLGDISGGQVIAQRLAALYGVGPEALSFYDFAAIGKIPPYRKAYRAALDEMALDERQRAELIAEAQEVFRLNTALFVELFATRNS